MMFYSPDVKPLRRKRASMPIDNMPIQPLTLLPIQVINLWDLSP